jgi:hypothetical protein
MRKLFVFLCAAFIASATMALFAPAGKAHTIGMEDAKKKPTILRLKRADITAELTLNNGRKITVTPTGTPVTPGTYIVKTLSIFKKDEKGKVWELRGTEKLGGINMLSIDEGQDKIIDPGPPVSYQGWSRPDPQMHDKINMRFFLYGRYNEQYYPSAYLNGQPAPPPTFRVVATDGKVLAADKFTITKESTLDYIWFAKGWKGKYKIELTPNLGPFDYIWAHDKTNYLID